MYGLAFSAAHLPVLSPRAVGMLHATFLCEPCRAAEARGSFVADCYIHVLLSMLEGVRCTWGPAGPPPETGRPAARPTSQPAHASGDAEWLDAEHDRMVAVSKVETLTDAQAADPAECALIASVRVAPKVSAQQPSTLPTGAAFLPAAVADARHNARATADLIRCGARARTPGAEQAAFAETLAAGRPAAKRRIVMGLHRTINPWTPAKRLRYSTIHDVCAPAPPGCAMRGSDGDASFYQLPIYGPHRRYFCYELPSGRIGRNIRCCFGGNASPSAEAFLTSEIKSVLRGGYEPGSMAIGGGGTGGRRDGAGPRARGSATPTRDRHASCGEIGGAGCGAEPGRRPQELLPFRWHSGRRLGGRGPAPPGAAHCMVTRCAEVRQPDGQRGQGLLQRHPRCPRRAHRPRSG